MLYVLKKEHIEHARVRALATAIINKEKAKETFDEYMKVAFPWLETVKSRDRNTHVQILMDEVKKGGLTVRPLWENKDKSIKSRLKMRVVDRDAKPEKKKTREEMNQFYEKLGKVVPI